jgi:hypothetical protein
LKKQATWFVIIVTLLIPNPVCFGVESKDHICFRAIDTDQDGKVTFEEFRTVLGDDQEKFKTVDVNQDGTLSHDEYHQSLGHGAPKED